MSNSSIDCGTSSVIFYLKVRYEYDCKTTYVLPTETITIRIRRHLWSLLTKRSPAHQCWSPAKWSGIESVQANTLKVFVLAKTLETETSFENTQIILYSTNNLVEKFSAINPTQFDEAGGEKTKNQMPQMLCRNTNFQKMPNENGFCVKTLDNLFQANFWYQNGKKLQELWVLNIGMSNYRGHSNAGNN